MPESMALEGPAEAGHYIGQSAEAGHYIGPRLAAWALGALTAVALAGSVYRVPIQVSDSLEVIERVIPMPSATAAFVDGLHNSPTMLRPLKEVRTRLLVQTGDALGGLAIVAGAPHPDEARAFVDWALSKPAMELANRTRNLIIPANARAELRPEAARYATAGELAADLRRFQTGQLVHRLKVGGRAMLDVARRKVSRGDTPTAESGLLLTDDTTTILGLSAWFEDQIAITDKLLVTPAFRYEHSNSKKYFHLTDNVMRNGTTATSNAGGAMPGLGVIYGHPKLNAFGSAYMGYSAPRISQAITPVGQDANLHAERSRNYEIGLRGRGDWLRAEANTFLIQFDNQLVSNNPLQGDSEFVDGGATRHLGAEATTSVRFGKGLALPFDLDLAAQYTFVQARFVGGQYNGKTVPYSPVSSANVTLDAASPFGLSGQIALGYIGAQYTDSDNTVEPGVAGLDGVIDAYTTLDVGARYRYAPSGVSFGVTAKSLLNKVYISDRLPNGIFTAGFRQIFATFAWSSDG